MSKKVSDSESIETTASDATILSLAVLDDVIDLNLVREDSPGNSFGLMNKDRLETGTLKSIESTVKDNLVLNRSNMSSQIEQKEEKGPFSFSASEGDLIKEAEMQALSRSNMLEEDEGGSTFRKIDIFAVSYCSEESSTSDMLFEMDDFETSSNDNSSISGSILGSQVEPTPISLEGNEASNEDTVPEKDTLENEENDSISHCSVECSEAKGANGTNADLGRNICAVDSIDEWVSELMNKKTKEEFESALTKS
jgi:hypothetical protein